MLKKSASQRLTLPVVILNALTIIGCDMKDLTSASKSSFISYSLTNKSGLYFTDSNGKLKQMLADGTLVDYDLNCNDKLHSIAFCSAHNLLAVTASSSIPKIADKIHIYSASSVSDLLPSVSFPGCVPCFSRRRSLLFYCRTNRFVERIGFGGNFWTDYEIWQYDVENNQHTKITNDTYLQIDDIAFDEIESEVYFSTIVQGDANNLEEHVLVLKLKDGSTRKLASCSLGTVCSGDPDISYDGDKLVFVSDRRIPFHYEVIEQRVESGVCAHLTNGKMLRFASHPTFDQSNCVYFLGTNQFTTDGQPKLQLFKLKPDGELKVVLGYDLLGVR